MSATFKCPFCVSAIELLSSQSCCGASFETCDTVMTVKCSFEFHCMQLQTHLCREIQQVNSLCVIGKRVSQKPLTASTKGPLSSLTNTDFRNLKSAMTAPKIVQEQWQTQAIQLFPFSGTLRLTTSKKSASNQLLPLQLATLNQLRPPRHLSPSFLLVQHLIKSSIVHMSSNTQKPS